MAGESLSGRGRLRQAFLTGVAVIVPLVITLVVLTIAFNAVYDYLDAFSSALVLVFPEFTLPVVGRVGRELLIEVATPVVFVASIVLIGLAVESTRYGEIAVDYVDVAMERVPGIGSVYEGFRQMSDVMLESDGGNFREVVLVEFPTEGTYTLAFVTSETPEAVADPSDGEAMRTLFMPMAPNPVMGGHVVFVPESRIVDVDLTVEQGIRALVTSGVALEDATGEAEGTDGTTGLSGKELRQLSVTGRLDERFDPPDPSDEAALDDDDNTETDPARNDGP
ncbi:DUF502 domain-containing protein [Halorubrum cibi]|uniref:Uncharacterized membrane protein n=1 Tax=Halorubrum cibi TaxID=413815 RepID=A0A521BEN3_9EURY|nr:DUF502 domain-containing protein [Halorubrum cibi]SMO45568.1 Uncharacterized membrane protein [Halorubrum cibi]